MLLLLLLQLLLLSEIRHRARIVYSHAPASLVKSAVEGVQVNVLLTQLPPIGRVGYRSV